MLSGTTVEWDWHRWGIEHIHIQRDTSQFLLQNLSALIISPTFSSLPMNHHMSPFHNSSHYWTSFATFPHSSPTPHSLRQNPVSASFFFLLFPILHWLIGLMVSILFHSCLICFPLWILQLLCNCTTVAPFWCFISPFIYLVPSHWTALFLSHYLSLGWLSFPLFHMVHALLCIVYKPAFFVSSLLS